MLQIFLYLQLLDLLTTLVGLRLGVSEASPFIRLVMQFGPAVAVILSKVAALALVGLCFALNRRSLIRRLNYGYAALAVWNLGIILISAGIPHVA
jgi:hypothetical protein